MEEQTTLLLLKIVVGLIVAGFAFGGVVALISHRARAYLKLREIEDDYAKKRLATKLHAKHMDYVEAIEKRHGDRPLLGEAVSTEDDNF